MTTPKRKIYENSPKQKSTRFLEHEEPCKSCGRVLGELDETDVEICDPVEVKRPLSKEEQTIYRLTRELRWAHRTVVHLADAVKAAIGENF